MRWAERRTLTGQGYAQPTGAGLQLCPSGAAANEPKPFDSGSCQRADLLSHQVGNVVLELQIALWLPATNNQLRRSKSVHGRLLPAAEHSRRAANVQRRLTAAGWRQGTCQLCNMHDTQAGKAGFIKEGCGRTHSCLVSSQQDSDGVLMPLLLQQAQQRHIPRSHRGAELPEEAALGKNWSFMSAALPHGSTL